jgi:hypothetical protein
MWGSAYEGYATALQMMTMSHLMRSSTILLRPALKHYLPNTNTLAGAKICFVQPVVKSRTMNTLQEASKIYNAFKKGGPSFGGWQVLKSTSIVQLDQLTEFR